MSNLCDTNIISELTRPIPNAGVIAWSGSMTSIKILKTLAIASLRYAPFAMTYL